MCPGGEQHSKLEALFDACAANLSAHANGLHDSFLCPLCLRLFSRDALGSHRVSIEHIIPSAIGGKLETLTCTDCNNRDGTMLDANIVGRLRAEDKLLGRSADPLRIVFKVESGEFAADFVRSSEPNTPIEVIGIPELSNPALHRRAIDAMKAGATVFTIKMNLGYEATASRVAIVRSAYLMMFRYFGYGYIKFNFLDQVRAQLATPSEETDVLKAVVKLASPPPDKNGVAILQRPGRPACFLAYLDYSTETKRYFGVALPGLDAEGRDLYQQWAADVRDGLTNWQADLVTIPYDPGRISHPGLHWDLVEIWRSLVQ